MGINLWILYYDLEQWEPHLINPPGLTDASLEYFSVYCQGSTLHPNCLYLIRSDQLAEGAANDATAHFLCLGKPDDRHVRAYTSLLWIPSEKDSAPLLSKLSEIFFRYSQWQNAMENAIFQQMPLEYFGILSLPFFRRPVTLFKYNFFCLFSVYDEHYGVLPVSQSTYTAETYLDEKIMEDIDVGNHLQTAINFREPYLYTSASGQVALSINLWNRDIHLATLQVDGVNAPFTEKDYSLIYYLGNALTQHILKNDLINFSLNSDLQNKIFRLLERESVNPGKLSHLLENIGWQISDTASCIVCRFQNPYTPENALFVSAEALSQIFPGSIYVIYQNQIILICNHRKMTGNEYTIQLEVFKRRLTELRLYAGLSSRFDTFDKLGYFYQTACQAMDYGHPQEPEKCLHCFEDYSLKLIQQMVLSDSVADIFIPEKLFQLLQYDRATDGDYCRVLYSLLKNNMSCTDAANELFMHRNTVLNRLNRMKEFFQMDFDDYEYRLKLMLAFQLLKEENTKQTLPAE